MRTSLHVATIAGIQVRLHLSLLIVLPIFAYLFGVIYLSAAQSAPFAPEVSSSAVWLFGSLMALGLFASVLLHELAHSLYALKKGGKVKEITLMMLGGVSRMTRMPTKPGQEALMALVGPLTSLALGLFSLALMRSAPICYYSVCIGSHVVGRKCACSGVCHSLESIAHTILCHTYTMEQEKANDSKCDFSHCVVPIFVQK